MGSSRGVTSGVVVSDGAVGACNACTSCVSGERELLGVGCVCGDAGVAGVVPLDVPTSSMLCNGSLVSFAWGEGLRDLNPGRLLAPAPTLPPCTHALTS